MHSLKAQHNLQHIKSLSERRLGQVLAALRWDATATCGGASGSFAQGDIVEYRREGYMSQLVRVLEVAQTRHWVQTVSIWSKSEFHAEQAQLSPVAHMQQRLLTELQAPNCDEVRIEYEASLLTALMLTPPKLAPAPTADNPEEHTAAQSRSRSRSPTEKPAHGATRHSKHREEAAGGSPEPCMKDVSQLEPDKVVRTQTHQTTQRDVYYPKRDQAQKTQDSRNSHPSRLSSNSQPHVAQPQPQLTTATLTTATVTTITLAQPATATKPQPDPNCIVLSSGENTQLQSQPPPLFDMASGSSTVERLGFADTGTRGRD